MFDNLKFSTGNVIQIIILGGGIIWQSAETRADLKVMANDISWIKQQQINMQGLIDESKLKFFNERGR